MAQMTTFLTFLVLPELPYRPIVKAIKSLRDLSSANVKMKSYVLWVITRHKIV